MLFPRFINVFAILLLLHVVAGAPVRLSQLKTITSSAKAIHRPGHANVHRKGLRASQFRKVSTAAANIHRTGKKNGKDVVGSMRDKDWNTSPHPNDPNKKMINPDKTKGLSYRTHPPSVVNKDSAHYEINEKHFGGTGLEVVKDGGGKMSVGHASLVWAGQKPIEAGELKKKINEIHAEHGTFTKGTSKERNNPDK